MTSVFDLFSQKKPDPAPANTGVSSPAAAAPDSAQGNPTVPNNNNTVTAVPGTQGAGDANGASPLDKFKDLWKTDPNAPKDVPFSFNSDPNKLLDTAKGVDFTKIVSPELQQRIQAGGADANAAMMEAMNSVAQLSFAQSSHASAKIVESALQAQEDRFKAMLPTLIKQHSVADSFRNDNPLMNDPAMAPMVNALQLQFTKQYPNATATQIKDHVNEFLNGAADRIQSARPQPATANKGRAEEDWSKFFN